MGLSQFVPTPIPVFDIQARIINGDFDGLRAVLVNQIQVHRFSGFLNFSF